MIPGGDLNRPRAEEERRVVGVFHLRIKRVRATMMEMRDSRQQRVRGQLSRDVGGINNRLRSVRIQSAFVARGPKSVPPPLATLSLSRQNLACTCSDNHQVDIEQRERLTTPTIFLSLSALKRRARDGRDALLLRKQRSVPNCVLSSLRRQDTMRGLAVQWVATSGRAIRMGEKQSEDFPLLAILLSLATAL